MVKHVFYYIAVVIRCYTHDWKYFADASEELGTGYVLKHLWHTVGGIS